jgi:tetratricopeptide (TPR) repeat protein
MAKSIATQSWLLAGIACLIAAQVLALLAYPQRPSANLDIGLTPTEAEAAAYGEQTIGEVFQDLEPGEFAGTLLLGGLRGLVTDLVWMRAMDAKETKQYYESVALFGLISRLQPRFAKVWEFGSHDMAYNIAHEAESRQDKFAWFQAGLEFNRQGVLRNPLNEDILRHLAWMFYHKGETLMHEVETTDWVAFVNPILARFDDQGLAYGQGVLRELLVDGRPGWVIQGTWDINVIGERPVGTGVLVYIDGALVGQAMIKQQAAQEFSAHFLEESLTEETKALLVDGASLRLSEQVGNYDLSSRLYRGCIELDERVERKRSPYVRRFIGISLVNDGNRLRNRGQHLAALRQYLAALEEWQDIYAYGLDPQNGFRPDEIRINTVSYQRNDGRLRRRCAIIALALAPDEVTGNEFSQAVMQRDFEKTSELLERPGWKDVVHTVGMIDWLDER